MLGGPPLYRGAASGQLQRQGVGVVSIECADGYEGGFGVPEDADAVLVHCESEGDWGGFSALALEGRRTVSVLPELNVDDLTRALTAGACPVHLRTSSEIIVETARAAASGEALLPVGLAQSLASKAKAAEAAEAAAGLSAIERRLVSALARNHSIARMARDLSCSDRTIRRRLQTLYVKLGVAIRGEAIQRCQLLDRGDGERSFPAVEDL